MVLQVGPQRPFETNVLKGLLFFVKNQLYQKSVSLSKRGKYFLIRVNEFFYFRNFIIFECNEEKFK